MPENRSDKVSAVTEWVREELEKNADPSYREFHRSLVPGLGKLSGRPCAKAPGDQQKSCQRRLLEFCQRGGQRDV